jgi:hypothetical protein
MRTHLFSIAALLLLMPLCAVPAVAQERNTPARFVFGKNCFERERDRRPMRADPLHTVVNGAVRAPNGAGIDPDLLQTRPVYVTAPQYSPVMASNQFRESFGCPRTVPVAPPAPTPVQPTVLRAAAAPLVISVPRNGPSRPNMQSRAKAQSAPPTRHQVGSITQSYPANLGYHPDFGSNGAFGITAAEVRVDVRGKVLSH